MCFYNVVISKLIQFYYAITLPINATSKMFSKKSNFKACQKSLAQLFRYLCMVMYVLICLIYGRVRGHIIDLTYVTHPLRAMDYESKLLTAKYAFGGNKYFNNILFDSETFQKVSYLRNLTFLSSSSLLS